MVLIETHLSFQKTHIILHYKRKIKFKTKVAFNLATMVLLGTPASRLRAPGFESQMVRLPAHPWRQQMKVCIVGFLPSNWETWKEVLDTGFNMLQIYLLEAFVV